MKKDCDSFSDKEKELFIKLPELFVYSNMGT